MTSQDSKKISFRKNVVIAYATLVMNENLIPNTLINKVVKTDQRNVLQILESEFVDSSTEFLSGSECHLGNFFWVWATTAVRSGFVETNS